MTGVMAALIIIGIVLSAVGAITDSALLMGFGLFLLGIGVIGLPIGVLLDLSCEGYTMGVDGNDTC